MEVGKVVGKEFREVLEELELPSYTSNAPTAITTMTATISTCLSNFRRALPTFDNLACA